MIILVICNDNVGDTGEIVRKYNAGKVISDFDNTGFESVARNWIKIASIERKIIRSGAEAYFSIEKEMYSYRKIYEKIITNHKK